ncbi:MAG: bifunctional 3-(3-hydroxy-phenyl)propionate/3-hydroxycinnamic acid hydroxylase [Burkholderiales bacterium]|nr:bifunctional 3-(3-hydroxy-phenyl)propionate/3-hydroxycinnamic acid hydroxylase [Burkholderiales bacterium]
MQDYDVAIVGFGPAGATAAALLGQAGVRTLVIDRLTEIYDRPRAFSLDHEIMRVFQNLGLAAEIAPHVAPFSASEHYGVDGQLIRRLTMIDPPYPLGWTPSMVFLQPPVEAALRRCATAAASVHVETGVDLTDLRQDESGVTLDLVGIEAGAAPRRARARYLIGCDGASSTVRRLAAIASDDLGFDEPWLVVDILLKDGGGARLPPASAQFCEPARPITYLIGTRNHRRFEIMLLPGEDPRAMEADPAVWQLLKRWLAPDEATLWRRASYRFHALVASPWRRGRVFLAGDAAHQQPPFLGQGMCQGVRDVANLSWKLAAVLSGRAGAALLDTYGEERSGHVRALTATIKHIGEAVCERDPARARQRDADLVAQQGGTVRSVPRQDLIPPLRSGLVSGQEHAAIGTLFPQPWVATAAGSGLLDDLAGGGVRVMLAADFDATALADDAAAIGARLIRFVAGPPTVGAACEVAERDGIVAAWFARHDVRMALVRPDHYVFGVARQSTDALALIVALRAGLRGASEQSSQT